MGDLRTRLQSALGDAYRIEKELGGGGMSRLFLATEASLHRQVVIKLLPPEFTSEVSEARFKQEIELAAHLQHPNILPVLTAGAKDDLLYYVMPFVSGESLRHRLTREGKLPVGEAVRILYEIADALAYAHAEGVIHRDVKPENILMLGAHVALTDFGVARALAESRSGGRLTDTGIALGTPAYMSPEQATGDRNIDARADVYGLAVVGYEMLAGRPPFAGPTAQAVIAAHLTTTPKPLTETRPETPTSVANAIAQALAKDPNARLRTAADLRDAIASAFPAPAPSRRRRTLGIVAVSLALLVVGLFLWTRNREPAGRVASGPTLVVLPFQNLGAAGDRYFADGITEEITTRLISIASIRVIGRTSVNRYQNTTKPPEQIGKELGAQYVLEGTIRTDRARGNIGQARVAPGLIRVVDGTNLWADAYTVDLTPGAIFETQAKIAERVAQALNVTLVGSERTQLAARPTANAEAYDAYLRGNDYLRRGLGQNWPAQRIAEQMYERATRLDPQFAQAYAALAATHLRMYQSTYDMSMTPHLTFSERLSRVKEAADQALKLDPGLPDLHRTLAGYYEALGDREQAEGHMELWWKAAPNDPEAIAQQAARQAELGRWREAQVTLDRATQLDPRSTTLLAGAAWGYARGGRYKEAESYSERWIALTPDDPQPYGFIAWLHLLQGDTAGARGALKRGATNVGLPNLLAAIIRNSWFINLLRLLPDYGAVVQGLSVESFDNDTADYVIAKALAYRSQPERARIYWDSNRVWSEAWIRQQPELSLKNAAAYISLAGSYAALGERDKAIAIIRDVDGIMQRGNRYAGNQGLIAEVFVMSGEPEAAIERLTLALHDPVYYSPALLRLDPIWEPLRGNPRFRALLKER